MRFFRIIIVLLVCAGWLCHAQCASAVDEDKEIEYQVKAAFVLNFLKFIEIPPEAFGGETNTITVFVVGKEPVVGIVERLLAGKTVDNRRIVVVKYPDTRTMLADGKMCPVVFVVSRAGTAEPVDMLALRTRAWLTIGESGVFCISGGVVGFRIDNGKVRFDINMQAARQAKLKISSHLLKLANVVGRD